jgi:hypothetical protein
MDDSAKSEQEAVLKRFCASPVSGHPTGTTGVLHEMCRRYWAEEEPLTADEVETFSQRKFSKTEEDQTRGVRVFLSRLRTALNKYFTDGDGKQELWILSIPPGRSDSETDYGSYTIVWSRKGKTVDLVVNGGITVQDLRAVIVIERSGDARIRYEYQIQNQSGAPLHGREVELWFEHPQPEGLKINGMFKEKYPVDIEVVRDYQNSKHYFLHFPEPLLPGESSSYWWEIHARRVFRDHHYWDLRIPPFTQKASIDVTHRLPLKMLTRTELQIRSSEGSSMHQNHPFVVDSRESPMRFRVTVHVLQKSRRRNL